MMKLFSALALVIPAIVYAVDPTGIDVSNSQPNLN
jgi:hypothetical protein